MPYVHRLWLQALGLKKLSLSKGKMWEESWRDGRAIPRDNRFVHFLRLGIWGAFGGGSARSRIPLLSLSFVCRLFPKSGAGKAIWL